jgi:uncharacterized integral membrane protein (TIGR00697 family)
MIGLNARLVLFNIPWVGVQQLPSGVFIAPLMFFIQDIVTEVYGYGKARQLTWIMALLILLSALYTRMVIYLPTTDTNTINQSFRDALDSQLKHVLSMLVGFFSGSILNDYCMAKLKIACQGRWLAMRCILSTMIGAAVFQIVASLIGWVGVFGFTKEWLYYVTFSFSYKIIFEIALLPFVYAISNFLKRKEHVDYYDYQTNFNPFIFFDKNEAENEKAVR